mgnify:CR=1 FL=1
MRKTDLTASGRVRGRGGEPAVRILLRVQIWARVKVETSRYGIRWIRIIYIKVELGSENISKSDPAPHIFRRKDPDPNFLVVRIRIQQKKII